ncbi:glycosyltransferase involved in cell wall biosynthesis [Kineococcus radiotolerans]|uniref:Glycosyltransferase involved in cell wall biosynthesis n=1 Tax=Kineococcus radiotolerans TaxID=131568 RepID=A0A7W4TKS8_KINRA|nr:glycosyltransferase family 4 protein [Kineococcus radiotolerans]MBB2900743.1 glycosyltransferase involved in cell wall biosynthesis [Kineococcus radiotolerans]
MTAPARRPRVLHVVQRYFPEMGGLETHVAEVTRGLAATGEFDVTVLTTDRSGSLARQDVVNGVPVLRRRSWPREGDLYLSPGLPLPVLRGHWDLVHVQGINTLAPPVGMLAARAARTPFVLTFHSGGHSSPVRTAGRGVQYRVLAPLLRRAARLIAVSRFERSAFAAVTGLPESRFSVIPNGGALPPSPVAVAPVPGRIVTSGRLERYKGHQRVIEALPLVRREVPEAHVVVLGSGPYEQELRDLARRARVAEHVEFRALPPADRAAMAGELARAGVMAAMSDYEAHPVGVMEAVTLGLPVVGADVAGIGDLVEDGLVHGVAPTAGAGDLAAALVAELVRTRSRGAVPHTPRPVELPTWETSVAATAEVYRTVLGGGRR